MKAVYCAALCVQLSSVSAQNIFRIARQLSRRYRSQPEPQRVEGAPQVDPLVLQHRWRLTLQQHTNLGEDQYWLRNCQHVVGEHLLVYTTAKQMPIDAIDHNRNFLPNCSEIKFFNNHEQALSVDSISAILSHENVVQNASVAWRSLRPWAFRSDVWRAMVLWLTGGLYLDHKMFFTKQVSDWIDFSNEDEIVLPKDCVIGCSISTRALEFFGRVPRVWNGVLFANRPRHRVWELVLRQIVSNIQNRYYGHAPWHVDGDLQVTGPYAYLHALAAEMDSLKPNRKLSLHKPWRNARSNVTQREFDVALVLNYDANQPAVVADADMHETSHKQTTEYGSHWRWGSVYCDEPIAGPDTACTDFGLPGGIIARAEGPESKELEAGTSAADESADASSQVAIAETVETEVGKTATIPTDCSKDTNSSRWPSEAGLLVELGGCDLIPLAADFNLKCSTELSTVELVKAALPGFTGTFCDFCPKSCGALTDGIGRVAFVKNQKCIQTVGKIQDLSGAVDCCGGDAGANAQPELAPVREQFNQLQVEEARQAYEKAVAEAQDSSEGLYNRFMKAYNDAKETQKKQRASLRKSTLDPRGTGS